MKNKKYLTMTMKESLIGYVFTSPWMIGFILFFAYPLLYSIMLAFSNVEDIVSFKLKFIGFKNFANAFIKDIDFAPMLLNSAWNMAVKTPVVVVFSLFIAILLNRDIKGKSLYRAAFFLPVLLGAGAVMQTLQGNSSYLSFGADGQMMQTAASGTDMMSLKEIGVSDRIAMLLGPVAASYVQQVLNQVSAILWMSGIQIIIFLGALQTIPAAYYEAAYCDGATEWEKFWKITLPLMMPTILLNIIYTMIDYFTNIENAVINYTITVTFKDFRLGYGSALGWTYFAIVGVLVMVVFTAMKKHTFYMDEK